MKEKKGNKVKKIWQVLFFYLPKVGINSQEGTNKCKNWEGRNR